VSRKVIGMEETCHYKKAVPDKRKHMISQKLFTMESTLRYYGGKSCFSRDEPSYKEQLF
jgi:hypothetical protein